jgi:hypothetical protein
MDSRKALLIGAPMAVLGAAGMILAPMLGGTELAEPLPFLTGFLVGVVTGSGVALSI